MKQSIKIIPGMFLVLLLYANFAFAVETFGPKKYIRSDGAPNVYTETFVTTAGPGKIIVRNGDYNGEKRVPYSISSARVFLNGTEIFSPNDFSQTVSYLESDINLNKSNSIRVELGSQPGDFLNVSIEQEISAPLALSITSPANGETVSGSDVIIKGSITNPLGKDVRIKINDVPAYLNGDQFVANKVALKEGENVITATAMAADGNTANQSITVHAVTSGNYLKLSAYADSGVAPLETTLKIDCTFAVAGQPSLSYTGPGNVEFLNSAVDGEYKVKMTTEGVYYFKAEAANSVNTVFKDEVAIIVFNESEQDAQIKAKWNGMKADLISGDIEGALEHFSPFSRGIYEEIFAALGGDVAGMATDMGDIELIYIKESIAKYRIKKDEAINGENHRITHYIYFIRDVYGGWHIDEF